MINIIVAITKDRAIGKRGELLYNISEDLKRFKRITMGYPIIMGRKTFESFPNGPLKGRRNIVLTNDVHYNHDGIELASNLPDAIKMAGEDIFLIGGSSVYSEGLPFADRIYLTEIDIERPDADAFFPILDSAEWLEKEKGEWIIDDKNNVKYRFITLERRTNG